MCDVFSVGPLLNIKGKFGEIKVVTTTRKRELSVSFLGGVLRLRWWSRLFIFFDLRWWGS